MPLLVEFPRLQSASAKENFSLSAWVELNFSPSSVSHS
jgi:hypothetical protein